jgi:hypothetical protein
MDLPHLEDNWFGMDFNSIKYVRLLGPELVLGKLFDQIGFDQVGHELFMHLVIARIISPGSKLKTVRYLEEHQRRSWDVQQVYRYMDKLHSGLKQVVEQISHQHMLDLVGGIGTYLVDTGGHSQYTVSTRIHLQPIE